MLPKLEVMGSIPTARSIKNIYNILFESDLQNFASRLFFNHLVKKTGVREVFWYPVPSWYRRQACAHPRKLNIKAPKFGGIPPSGKIRIRVVFKYLSRLSKSAPVDSL